MRTRTEIRFTAGRFSTASSTPAWSAACGPTWRSVSCRKTFQSRRSLTSTSGPRARVTKRFTRAGPILRKTTASGRNSSSSGPSIASRNTDALKWRRGIGKCGTKRTSVIGGGLRRNFASSTITLSTRCDARCPRRRLAALTPPAAAADSLANSSSIVCVEPITRPARSARPSISFHFTRKALPLQPTATCAWASPINCAPSMTASGS